MSSPSGLLFPQPAGALVRNPVSGVTVVLARRPPPRLALSGRRMPAMRFEGADLRRSEALWRLSGVDIESRASGGVTCAEPAGSSSMRRLTTPRKSQSSGCCSPKMRGRTGIRAWRNYTDQTPGYSLPPPAHHSPTEKPAPDSDAAGMPRRASELDITGPHHF